MKSKVTLKELISSPVQLNERDRTKLLGLAPARKKKKTWSDSLDERMHRLKYSDESMIHFRKSKSYMNIAKMNFKDNSDEINGIFEIDEAKKELEEEGSKLPEGL